jgi:hypothetical protein
VGFVKDSPLYEKAKDAKKGDFLHVVGIPRVNLNLFPGELRMQAAGLKF